MRIFADSKQLLCSRAPICVGAFHNVTCVSDVSPHSIWTESNGWTTGQMRGLSDKFSEGWRYDP